MLIHFSKGKESLCHTNQYVLYNRKKLTFNYCISDYSTGLRERLSSSLSSLTSLTWLWVTFLTLTVQTFAGSTI